MIWKIWKSVAYVGLLIVAKAFFVPCTSGCGMERCTELEGS